MFAPKAVKPQTKTTESPTNKLMPQRSTARPFAIEQVPMLQRGIGNQSTLRLLAQMASRPVGKELDGDREYEALPPEWASRAQGSSPQPSVIQAKLSIGPVDDPLEHEADRVADQVMRMPDPETTVSAAPLQISRKCEACEKEDQEKSKLQMKPAATPSKPIGAAPAIVHDVLQSSGHPLDTATRAFMEPRFGHDFSRVRVHTDTTAAESARAVHARAYTQGEHIVFAHGRYAPTTTEGKRLVGHELAHVVQQSAGRVASPTPSGDVPIVTNNFLEEEADAAGEKAGRGEVERVLGVSGGATQLKAQGGPIQRAATPANDNATPLSTPDGNVSSPAAAIPGILGKNFTSEQQALLAQARQNLKPEGDAIVGVLLPEGGEPIELMSGGGQGFSAHIEGKAVKKMNELGIKQAILLVEKEPCQICDRSVYPGGEQGPEVPLISSKSGEQIDYQISKINTGLPKDTKLTVIGPKSTGFYKGVANPNTLGGSSSTLAPGNPSSPGGSKPPANVANDNGIPYAAPGNENPIPSNAPGGNGKAPPAAGATPPTAKPSGIASAEGAESVVKPPAAPAPASKAGVATDTPSVVAGAAKASLGRIALSFVVQTAIFMAINIFISWVYGKLLQSLISADIDTLLRPAITKRLNELAPKIEALRGSNKKVFVRITYELSYTRSTLPPIMVGPPSYIIGSVQLINIHPGNEDLDFDPNSTETVSNEYPVLLTERVAHEFSYSVLVDDPQQMKE